MHRATSTVRSNVLWQCICAHARRAPLAKVRVSGSADSRRCSADEFRSLPIESGREVREVGHHSALQTCRSTAVTSGSRLRVLIASSRSLSLRSVVTTVTVATNMAGRGTDVVLGGNPDIIALRKQGLDLVHTPDDDEAAASGVRVRGRGHIRFRWLWRGTWRRRRDGSRPPGFPPVRQLRHRRWR